MRNREVKRTERPVRRKDESGSFRPERTAEGAGRSGRNRPGRQTENGEDSAEIITILVSYGKTAQMMHIFIEKNNLYGAIYLKVLNYSLYSENMERVFRTVNDINTNSNLCVGYVDEEYQCVAVRASLLLPPDSDIAGQILMEAIYRTYNTAQDMYKALTEYIKYIVP